MSEEKKILTKEEKAEQIILNNKMIKQAEDRIKVMEKDYEIKKKLVEFEKANCHLVGDKPAYLVSEEYFKLVMEQKDFLLEETKKQIADNVSRANDEIKQRKQIIKEMNRNHEVVIEDGTD